MRTESFVRKLYVCISETENGLQEDAQGRLDSVSFMRRAFVLSLTNLPSLSVSLIAEMGLRPATEPCSSSVR